MAAAAASRMKSPEDIRGTLFEILSNTSLTPQARLGAFVKEFSCPDDTGEILPLSISKVGVIAEGRVVKHEIDGKKVWPEIDWAEKSEGCTCTHHHLNSLDINTVIKIAQLMQKVVEKGSPESRIPVIVLRDTSEIVNTCLQNLKLQLVRYGSTSGKKTEYEAFIKTQIEEDERSLQLLLEALRLPFTPGCVIQ